MGSLKSSVKQLTELKLIKTARGLNALLYRCGVEIVNTVEVPQYVIFKCTESHINCSLEKIAEEYSLQTELPKGKCEHSVDDRINCVSLKHTSEPYLKLNLLCLAFIHVRFSMEKKAMSGFGIKNFFIQSSQGRKCFGTYIRGREFYTFNNKYVRVFIRKSNNGGRVAVLNRYLE